MQFLGEKTVESVENIDEFYINNLTSKRLLSQVPQGERYFYTCQDPKLKDIIFQIFNDQISKAFEHPLPKVDKDSLKSSLAQKQSVICPDVLIFNIENAPYIRDKTITISSPVVIDSLGRVFESSQSLQEIEIYFHAQRLKMNLLPFECLSSFRNVHKSKIKYTGIIGKSGYAKACRNITSALRNENIEYYFEPLNKDDPLEEDIPNLCRQSSNTDYETVIFHAIPSNNLLMLMKRENNKKIILITVWETLEVPEEWKECMKYCHLVLAPSYWNMEVFKRINPDTQYLPHPVPVKYFSPHLGKYTFYTINEWNGRKHLEDILIAYSQEFNSSDDVHMIFKTSSILPCDLEKYIESLNITASIEIINDSLPEEEIENIHKRSNCFISMSAGEGMGYGLCEAVMRGRIAISTSFGAQTEYLKGIYYVSTYLEPAIFCTSADTKHKNCGEKCKINSNYFCHTWGKGSKEDLRRTMRFVYENNIRENKEPRKFLMDNFSLEKIGKMLREKLEN